MCIRKIKLYILLGLFSLSLVLGVACDHPSQKESRQSLFDEFITEIFTHEVQSDTLSLNYTLAHPEDFGIVHTEATLG